jgi:membrane protein
MKIADFFGIVKDAAAQWSEDNAPRLGAALAFYTAFSLAPLLLISIAIAGFIFGEEAARGQIIAQVQGLIGAEGGAVLQSMLVQSSQPDHGIIATLTGLFLLLFGAAALFGELQDSLNWIWKVRAKPGHSLIRYFKNRFLSFTMVLGTAFLLLVSLIVSALLSALGSMGIIEAGSFGQIINFAISFTVITLLFAMIYRFLPDAVIAWRDVWLGAVITSLLFGLGKFLIGLYLGQAAVGSPFGAAASLAVLLIWIYYAAQIFLFGVELTKAYVVRLRGGVRPAANAELIAC